MVGEKGQTHGSYVIFSVKSTDVISYPITRIFKQFFLTMTV